MDVYLVPNSHLFIKINKMESNIIKYQFSLKINNKIKNE